MFSTNSKNWMHLNAIDQPRTYTSHTGQLKEYTSETSIRLLINNKNKTRSTHPPLPYQSWWTHKSTKQTRSNPLKCQKIQEPTSTQCLRVSKRRYRLCDIRMKVFIPRQTKRVQTIQTSCQATTSAIRDLAWLKRSTWPKAVIIVMELTSRWMAQNHRTY